MKLIIKPEGPDSDRYTIHQESSLVGYVVFESGPRPWVVYNLAGNQVSAHVFLREARASANLHLAA